MKPCGLLDRCVIVKYRVRCGPYGLEDHQYWRVLLLILSQSSKGLQKALLRVQGPQSSVDYSHIYRQSYKRKLTPPPGHVDAVGNINLWPDTGRTYRQSHSQRTC